MKKNLTLFLILIAYLNSYSQNLWTLSDTLPGTSRAGALSFSIGNEAYFGTGYGSNLLVLNDMWKYNAYSHNWTQLNNFPINVYNPTVFVINDTAYITNGWMNTGGTANTNTYRYDSGNDTYSLVASYPGTPCYTAFGFEMNNKAYVGAGYSPLTNELWEYDPSIDQWTQKTNFPGTLRQNCSAFSIGGIGYVGFGALNPVIAYDDLWSYDPGTDVWTQLPSCPGGGRFDGIEFTLNGKIYAGCGYDFSNYFRDIWSFDPFTNTWAQESDFGGQARYSTIQFTLGNSVFAGSGRAANYFSDLWEYTPSDPNKITGLVYRDENANDQIDSSETPVKNLLIEVNPGGLFYSTDNVGIFQALASLGTHTITIPNFPPYYSYSGIDTITFNTTGITDTSTVINLTPVSIVNDLEVIFTPLTQPQPGNEAVFNLACTNNGNTISQNTTLISIIDTAFLTVTNVLPNDSNYSISGDSLIINIGQLASGEQKSYMIYAYVSTSATFNDSVSYYGAALPILNDTTPLNNETSQTIAVVGSFDPNDISVSPEGSLTPTQVSLGQYLTYTIRFQNTGTAAANEVRVLDSIPQSLDLSTFEMVTASHNYEIILNGDRKLKWQFKNINLADSNTNEPASHGFIKYRIKALNTLQLGDVIENKADIYFDYNAAVATNITSTPIQLTTGLTTIESNTNNTSIYPNPTSGIVNIKSNNTVKSVALYDVQGKLILNDLPVHKNSVNLSTYLQGFYMLKVTTIDNRSSIYKVVLSK